MTDREIVGVDLFCGAGGFSEGLHQACQDLGYGLRHAAINHWQPAIETHESNHSDALQYHSKVEQLHPPNVIDDLVDEDVTDVHTADVNVDILVAGPECTHFSNARGDKPVSEQKRMSPWQVLDWIQKLDVDAFCVENVSEIQSWGPVEDGEPTRDGSVFEAWINVLNQMGYAVDWTTLNASHFGDPTSRERFFLVGRQHGSVTFPGPTHSDDDPELPDRRTAAEIIDWSDLGTSIWTRDVTEPRVHTPPKDTTMERIAEGIRRHCADVLSPFADVLEQLGRDEIRELRTERAVPAEFAGLVADTVDDPFLVAVPDASTQEPFVLGQHSNSVPRQVTERPTPTVAGRGNIHLCTPATASLLMPKNGMYRGPHSNPLYEPDSRPFHTVTSDPRASLVSPYLSPLYNPSGSQRPRTRDVDRPLMTVPASKSPAALTTPCVRPFVDDFENDVPHSVSQPLKTITSRDKFALCVPELWPWGLDIKYRMLQPDELKQAQGFPSDYVISGTKEEKKKQIGNAVPVHLAKNLCKHVLTAEDPSLATYGGGISGEGDVDIPDYEEVVSDD